MSEIGGRTRGATDPLAALLQALIPPCHGHHGLPEDSTSGLVDGESGWRVGLKPLAPIGDPDGSGSGGLVEYVLRIGGDGWQDCQSDFPHARTNPKVMDCSTFTYEGCSPRMDLFVSGKQVNVRSLGVLPFLAPHLEPLQITVRSLACLPDGTEDGTSQNRINRKLLTQTFHVCHICRSVGVVSLGGQCI